MKKAIIIHGWGGSPKQDWLQWVKQELEKKGFKVIVPEMPDTFFPKISSWISKLKEVSGKIDKDTYFIGHSIGCQAIMRFLERLPENVKVGGVVLVAGWFNLSDDTWDENYTQEIAEPWIKNEINFDKIKLHTNKIVDIASDNDPYVSLDDAEIFKNKLDAEIIVLKDKGHISGEDGVKELPIVIDKVLEMSK